MIVIIIIKPNNWLKKKIIVWNMHNMADLLRIVGIVAAGICVPLWLYVNNSCQKVFKNNFQKPFENI